MTESVTAGVEPSDVLGGAMFVVGVVVLLNLGNVPPELDSSTVGVVLMVLGTGAVFGRETFVELVQKLLISNGETGGNSDRDGSSGSEGDDETGDGEVGIGRPPGEEVEAET